MILFPFGKQNMLDDKATILKIINPNSCGVRELIKKLNWKTARVTSLLKTMQNEGLIDFHENKTFKRGRPKKIIVATILGCEFLESFKECKRKAIQINQNDVKSAARQAYLAKKLEEYHISPDQRFMELNSIALKIRNSITN
jgi:predicted transcriptional regulator